MNGFTRLKDLTTAHHTHPKATPIDIVKQILTFKPDYAIGVATVKGSAIRVSSAREKISIASDIQNILIMGDISEAEVVNVHNLLELGAFGAGK